MDLRIGHRTLALPELDRKTQLSGTDFRPQATIYVVCAFILMLTPLTVFHWFQGSRYVALGLFGVMGILAFNVHRHVNQKKLDACNLYLFSPFICAVLAGGIVIQGQEAALWAFPVLMAFYCTLSVRQAMLANAMLILSVSGASIYALPMDIYLRVMAALITSAIFAGIMVRAMDQQHRLLRSQVVTDHLTGVFNRVLLETTLESALATYRSAKKPMTLLSLDVDHFKMINDKFGHLNGDTVLKELGALLNEKTRKADFVFRLGGEEFLILLHGSTVSNGRQVAESLRNRIAEMDVLADQLITVSVGVAELAASESTQQWLRRADQNLYRAKELGRNRVVN